MDELSLPASNDAALCPFGRRAVEQILNGPHCRTALHLAAADSTNRVALSESAGALPREVDDPYPRLIVADHQTAGRGRQGRSWHSDAGTLTFSWVERVERLRLDEATLPAVALAVGMAVADAVESFIPPFQTRLKWPNDVYAAGKKVAGILVESATVAPRRLVIGIGVNVATEFSEAAEDVRGKATSLAELSGHSLQRYHLLPLLVACLSERLDELRSDRSGLMAVYRRRCLLSGRTVRFTMGKETRSGRVLGVDDLGGLRVETPRGTQTIRSGEVLLDWSGPA